MESLTKKGTIPEVNYFMATKHLIGLNMLGCLHFYVLEICVLLYYV